jgi:hypothetical protein
MITRYFLILITLLCLVILGGCNNEPAATLIPTQATPTPTSTPGEIEVLTPTATKLVGTPAITPTATDLVSIRCLLGTGLRQQTVPVLLSNAEHNGFVMTASNALAEQYFPQLDGWIRVLGAPSLDQLEQKALRAEESQIPYEALAYGLETSVSTPDAEWQNLVASAESARSIADVYDKLLVIGPGFQLMSQNEDKYPAMAAQADMWMLQTQRLQANPPGPSYRAEVERVVDLITSGNPEIQIWAQITLPPDREPSAQEWIEYHNSIYDLVSGNYIGVYTWDTHEETVLVDVISEIFKNACGSAQ